MSEPYTAWLVEWTLPDWIIYWTGHVDHGLLRFTSDPQRAAHYHTREQAQAMFDEIRPSLRANPPDPTIAEHRWEDPHGQ